MTHTGGVVVASSMAHAIPLVVVPITIRADQVGVACMLTRYPAMDVACNNGPQISTGCPVDVGTQLDNG